MFLVLALTQMLGVGTTALIAHATGRKDRDAARLVFNQSQVLSLVVGVVFLVVMMALRDWLTRAAQSADPETARLAARLPDLVHPGDGAAVRDGGDGRRRCAAPATSSPG